MRVLRFIVDGVTIKADPTCDFSNLYPGAGEQIQAKFTFSSEWESMIKVVGFWSVLNKEYPPQPLNEDNTCLIPAEALESVAFKIKVLGGKRRSAITRTNEVVVYQRGRRG